MHIILQYSYEDLLNLVQASSMELQTALQKLQACQIEGKTDYCTDILTKMYVLQTCQIEK